MLFQTAKVVKAAFLTVKPVLSKAINVLHVRVLSTSINKTNYVFQAAVIIILKKLIHI